MSKTKAKLPEFEQSMQELETLVTRLEKGDLPLEEALQQFERGVALTRACQIALQAAEQKVEILLKTSTGETASDEDSSADPSTAATSITATSITIEEFEPES